MAQAIVDQLEAVQVQKEQGQAAAFAHGLLQGLLQAVHQQHAVGQSGEGVVPGLAPHGVLGLAAAGDVAHGGHVGRLALVKAGPRAGFHEHGLAGQAGALQLQHAAAVLLFLEALLVLGDEEAEKVGAQQLALAPAEDGFEAAVDREDGAVDMDGHAIESHVGQALVALLALAQAALDLLAGLHIAGQQQ